MINRIRNPKSEIRNRRGFTLVEILIVVAIAGILLGIGGRTYFIERDRFVYNSALVKTLDLIKTARNSAINTSPVTVNNGGTTEDKIPTEGYGIYINLAPATDEPHITVFANFSVTSDNINKFDNQGTTIDHVIETYRLPKQIQLQNLIFDYGKGNKREKQSTEKEAVILFKPPLANTYLFGDYGISKIKELQELSLRFFNRELPASSPKKCQYIRIDKIKGYPYIEYDNCL